MNPLLVSLLQQLEPAALQLVGTLLQQLTDHVNHANATHPSNQK